MDKLVDALGPWPILQTAFGLTVLGVGIFALVRGLYSAKAGEHQNLEDARKEWEAYQQLASIEHHTERIAENQKLMLDRIVLATDAIRQMSVAINQLRDVLWNSRQG